MTAIFLMLKTFFGGLIPGGAGAVASIVTNPLGTIKKILTLLIVVIVVAVLGYFAFMKIKQHNDDRNKVEVGLATTATNNAKTADVAKQSGAIDTDIVAQAGEEKQKLIDAANDIEKEHAAWIAQLKKEENLKTPPERVVKVPVVKKPVKKGSKPAEITEPIITVEVPPTETVRSKKIAAANIAYLWKSYCNAVSESEEPCPI